MTSPRLSLSLRIVLVALGSLTLAINLAHWVFPDRSGLTAMRWPVSWIEPEEFGKQAYFRSTFDVPFNPTWAWIAVAAEDYQIFVNGTLIARNQYTEDNAFALLHRIKDLAQSLTPFAPAIAYKPEMRRASNEEWRFPITSRLLHILHPGRNVIALFVESPDKARFAVRGEIFRRWAAAGDLGKRQGLESHFEINRKGNGGLVRSAPEFELGLSARNGELLENPVYAPAPPDIWERPMRLEALTGQTSGGELKLGLTIPGVGPAQQKPSWIRVYSNWVYYLFVGDQLVGSGGGSGPAEAWDITAFQSPTAQRIVYASYARTISWPRRSKRPCPSCRCGWRHWRAPDFDRWRLAAGGRCCSWLARARRRGVEARLGRAFKQTEPSI